MAWTKARWSNPCGANARLGDLYKAMCQRKAGHGGKWHRDGEVCWRVSPAPAPDLAEAPHLHTLRLALAVNLAEPLAHLAVPLPCGTGNGQVFSREYLADGTLIRISGSVT